MVTVEVNCQSIEDSNLLLRALWAECRETFSKCAWQYIPHRDGERGIVHFGFANIDMDTLLEVSVSYQRKGVIRSVMFEGVNGVINEELASELTQVVRRAFERPLISHTIHAKINSTLLDIAPYSSEHFVLMPLGKKENLFSLQVEGFDRVDAEAESLKFLGAILDFLAVCTNSAFVVRSLVVDNGELIPNVEPAFFSDDFDWIDESPADEKGRFLLWANQKEFIEKILSKEILMAHPFLRASYHFHAAQTLLKSATARERVLNDIAIVLFMSALEVGTELYPFEPSHCDACGQPIYAIRQRVLDLARKFTNAQIVQFIDAFYSQRSKFLHAGFLSTDANYVGTSIPQLDPSSSTGCRMQVSIPPIVLGERVGFILRKVYMERIA